MTCLTWNFKFVVTAAALLYLGLLATSQENCPVRISANIEEGRTCRKSCQSQADCRGSRKGCICDDVCGLSCHNPNAACLELEQIENGYFEGQNRYKERVTYHCNDGYQIRGNSERICRSDRKWSGTAPTCVAVCKTPRGSRTAYPVATKNNYNVGESLYFECRPGYVLSTEEEPEITCQPGGEWTEAAYSCTKVLCDVPGILQNGFIEGENFEFGSQVILGCNRGYILNSPIRGQNYSTCTTRKTWVPNTDDFNCQIVECDAPQPPEHGSVNLLGIRNFGYGQQVTYSCDVGYRINGNIVRSCEDDGTWGEIPTCQIDDDCDFERSARPTCGFTNRGWSRQFSNDVPNERRGYLARAEFSPRRESTATLTSPSLLRRNPICLRFYYKLSGNDDSLSLRLRIAEEIGYIWRYNHLDQKNTWLSSDYWFEPEAGDFQFYFEANKRWSRSSAEVEMDDITTTISDEAGCVDECKFSPCENGGTCINRINGFTCFCDPGYSDDTCSTVATCDVPDPPSDGNILPRGRETVRFGTTIRFSCNIKFNLIGESSSRCQTDETWTNTFPRCKEIKCNLPSRRQRSSGLSVTPDQEYVGFDETITYACNNGYRMDGRQSDILTVTCRRDNTFSHNTPRCEKIQCVLPNPRSIGLIVTPNRQSIGYNAVFTFTCEDNYRMVEVPSEKVTSTCLRNDRLSQNMPRCEEIRCYLPSLSQRSEGLQINPNRQYVGNNQEITYTCRDGYRMDGIPANRVTARCSRNGQFSANKPECIIIRCNVLQIPNGRASISGLSIAVTEEVSYTCDTNYEIRGPNRVTCQRNKQLTQLPSCQAISCNVSSISNGRSSTRNSTVLVDEQVTYTCDEGYEIQGLGTSNTTVVCQQSKMLTYVPSCQSSDSRCSNIETETLAIPSLQRDDWSVGEEVNYTCPDNHKLRGESKLRCNVGGQWSSEYPSCENRTCSSEPLLEFEGAIDIQDVYYAGDIVTFECPFNYSIVGSSSVQCNKNQSWSSEVPTCKEQLPACPKGYEHHEHFCLNINFENKTNDEALSFCKEDNAFLPTVRSSSMNRFIINFARKKKSRVYWLGLTLKNNISRWSTGQEYLPGDYNNYIESRFELSETKSCLTGRTRRRLEWRHRRCSNMYYSKTICVKWSSSVRPLMIKIGNTSTMNYFPEDGKVSMNRSIYLSQTNENSTTTFLFSSRIEKKNYWFMGQDLDPNNATLQIRSNESYPQDITEEWQRRYNDNFDDSHKELVDINILSYWNMWSDWSECSATCGNGTQIRERNCSDHQIGSLYCLGSRFQFKRCDKLRCLASCTVPDVPHNGLISENSGKSLQEGSSIFFSCNYGYKLNGSNHNNLSSTCNQNGRWSTSSPMCTEIQCSLDDIDDIDLYSISPEKKIFLVNENLTYECIENYRVRNQSGNRQNIVTCLDENKVGSWSDDLPQCEYNGCSIPSVIEHGNIETSSNQVLIGSEIRFSCDVGYQISGSSTLRCVNVNTWSQELPSCVLIVGEWSDWSMCSRSCGTGNQTRQRSCLHQNCNVNREETQLCNTNNCEIAITLGTKTYRLFERNERYFNSRSICQNEYNGNVATIKTQVVSDALLRLIPNEQRNNQNKYFMGILKLNGIWIFVDGGGRVPLNNNNNENFANWHSNQPHDSHTCAVITGAGFWESSRCNVRHQFFCEKVIGCSVPQSFGNGSIDPQIETLSIGESIIYSCDDGFSMEGGQTTLIATCQRSGRWNSNQPKCKADDPCNSSLCRNGGTCTMIERQRFSCSCSYGYTGNRCENEISCMVPARPTHGTKSPQSNEVPLNSMVYYRCNEGFTFSGRSTNSISVTCEESGQVSEGIPPCVERNPCDSIPCQNGGTCLRFNGQSYRCTCEAGFTGRTCDNEIRCVLPAQPIHGTKSHESEKVFINTEVTYRCNQGFMFDGTSTRVITVTCEESGEVSDEIPPCVGLWNGWSNWSGCSQTCDGRRTKTRTCPSDSCPGSNIFVEPCGAACPLEAGSGIKKFGLYTEMVNFDEARRRCGQLFNGTLAQVKSRQETQAIIRLIYQRKTTRSRFVYFGIIRDDRNNWTYLDGTPVPAKNRRTNQDINYHNWDRNEPNNIGRNENCGSLFARSNNNVGKWADSRCDRNRNFVCETVIGCTVPASLSRRISLDPSNVRTRRVGKSVTYQCADDYVISGTGQSSVTVTCLSPEQWSHNELTCEEFNPCNSSPCQNGGTCNRNGQRGYFCTCVSHVIGNACQTIQNPCYSSPCQNGGTCRRINTEQYRCDCSLTKYAGDRCHLKTCTAPQVSRILEIANANDDNKYATGDTLRLRCRNQAEIISIRRGIITCVDENRWSPTLSIIRCI